MATIAISSTVKEKINMLSARMIHSGRFGVNLLLFGFSINTAIYPIPALSSTTKPAQNSIIDQATVRILTPGGSGSGVLVQKDKGLYTVLTTAHVVECRGGVFNGDEIDVQVASGLVYSVKSQDVQCPSLPTEGSMERSLCDEGKRKEPWAIDIATLRFRSENNYLVASKHGIVRDRGISVIISGYPQESGRLIKVTSNGQTTIPPSLVENTCQGYGLRYLADTRVGMSGGGVWNARNELVGIHGYRETIADRVAASYSLAIPVSYWMNSAHFSRTRAPLNESFNRSNARIISAPDFASQGLSLMNAATSEDIASSRKTDLLAKAINNFSQARQADPKQPAYFAREAQAYLLLYEMDQRRSDLESAFDLANQAIRISRRWSRSYDAQYEVLRASIHASAGNLHKALEDINTRLDRAPRDVEALRDKANYLLKLNRLRESYDVLNQAIAYNPSSPRLYNDRGYLYQRASLMRSACRDWQAAIKLAIAFKSKGSIYAQEGANQIVRARQAYNQNC